MKLETLYSMKPIKYIFVNETTSPSPTPASLGSISSDFRHSHIINALGLSHSDLINVLLLARRHYPEAKILGLSEINGRKIRPSAIMNEIRRELSDLP